MRTAEKSMTLAVVVAVLWARCLVVSRGLFRVRPGRGFCNVGREMDFALSPCKNDRGNVTACIEASIVPAHVRPLDPVELSKWFIKCSG